MFRFACVLLLLVGQSLQFRFPPPLHSKPTQPSPNPQACSHFSLPRVPGYHILSTDAAEVYNFTYTLPPTSTATAVPLDFCNITITFTHGTDIVFGYFWVPLEGWNGRYVVGGGGGLAAGNQNALPGFVAQGYAAATTDGGLSLNNTANPSSGQWILKQPGQFNEDLVINFAHRAIHDMAVLGKALVKSYSGHAPRYSYYSGCSTGGRQGYESARSYPKDFDGIQANAPVIYTTRYSPSDVWPVVVMNNIVVPPNCVFNYFQQRIMQACDGLDGLSDGIFTNPLVCHFDPYTLVGTTIPCSDTGSDIAISSSHAEVVAKILQGPRSQSGEFQWYGLITGASFGALANTTTTNGVSVPTPFGAAIGWVTLFTYKDPSYSVTAMTFADFDDAYDKSVELLSSLFSFDTPDMHAFQRMGKKMLTYHGQADQFVSPEGTIKFRHALEATHGGPKAVDDFQKIFLAPGAAHCGSGVGPAPNNPLGALAAWVERGIAPVTLEASTRYNGTVLARDLCLWPKLPYYNGAGDPNAASSFHCA
ncbi:tannase and feruloyl esterase [Aulographum hederae CBS 113979]|uniref:Carboxylic ester hydrolase n=1 Tax=Aulographum hederae CBS 113979 TaxID=1176131 RepID=A0A6G1GMI3_9PEZI|nr:tannase and feruloyl esterase [Aulographum hederae CBS 113979]